MADWNKVERDIESGPGGLFKWFAIGIVCLVVLFTGLNYAGLIGSTVVKRTVFEQSYQYKAGMASRGAILEANLVELQEQLRQASSAEEQQNIESQIRVIRSQLRAITIND